MLHAKSYGGGCDRSPGRSWSQYQPHLLMPSAFFEICGLLLPGVWCKLHVAAFCSHFFLLWECGFGKFRTYWLLACRIIIQVFYVLAVAFLMLIFITHQFVCHRLYTLLTRFSVGFTGSSEVHCFPSNTWAKLIGIHTIVYWSHRCSAILIGLQWLQLTIFCCCCTSWMLHLPKKNTFEFLIYREC